MLRQKTRGGNKKSAHKRALSHAEIVQCERATQPACDCRCGGALHGANRAPESSGRDFFESLPGTDPHHLQTRVEKSATSRSSSRRRRDERRRSERDTFMVEKERRRAERVAAWERQGINVRV